MSCMPWLTLYSGTGTECSISYRRTCRLHCVCALLCKAQLKTMQGICMIVLWSEQTSACLTRPPACRLQLLGFSDLTASLLMALFAFGCALGAFAGGWIGGNTHTTCCYCIS